MINKNKTAILVFSRTAREEAAVKSFSPGNNFFVNESIAQCLISHTVTTARDTGLPVYTKFTSEQNGSNFNDRLTNAISDIFDLGYEQVITIGSDCPMITPQVLKEAVDGLRNSELVLGPAHDGGVYLIGLQRQAFSQHGFLKLKWLTKNLISSFRNYAHVQSISLQLLDEKQDVDNAKDLKDLLKSISTNYKLLKLLRNILHSIWSYLIVSFPFSFQIQHFFSLISRPPPVIR